MHRYIIRRLLQAIPIIIGITIITFSLAKAMPGDPFSSILNPNITAADLLRMREQTGLTEPLHVQYFNWLKQMLQGNFGISFSHNKPVVDLIGERIGVTLTLNLISLLIGFGLAIPIGVIVATRQYSLTDNIGTLIAFIGISVPSFFTALLAIRFLAIGLDMFPTGGLITIGAKYAFPYNYLDMIYHLTLPALVLGFFSVAGTMRYVRSSMLEVIRQDYIQTARAKGLAERVVIYKHALRNALIPVVTILGLSLPGLISGAIISEQIFSIPGMGTAYFQSISARDYPVVMGFTLLFAIFTVIGNLSADIAYGFVDPRIRYD